MPKPEEDKLNKIEKLLQGISDLLHEQALMAGPTLAWSVIKTINLEVGTSAIVVNTSESTISSVVTVLDTVVGRNINFRLSSEVSTTNVPHAAGQRVAIALKPGDTLYATVMVVCVLEIATTPILINTFSRLHGD